MAAQRSAAGGQAAALQLAGVPEEGQDLVFDNAVEKALLRKRWGAPAAATANVAVAVILFAGWLTGLVFEVPEALTQDQDPLCIRCRLFKQYIQEHAVMERMNAAIEVSGAVLLPRLALACAAAKTVGWMDGRAGQGARMASGHPAVVCAINRRGQPPIMRVWP